jgi:hypothetical protein
MEMEQMMESLSTNAREFHIEKIAKLKATEEKPEANQ